MKRGLLAVTVSMMFVLAAAAQPAAAAPTGSAGLVAVTYPTCVSPNPADTCVLVRVNHGHVIGNRKPFTVTAPIWLEVRVVNGEPVNVTVLRNGGLFVFSDGCAISCGLRIDLAGEYALLLNDSQTPSLTFTVVA